MKKKEKLISLLMVGVICSSTMSQSLYAQEPTTDDIPQSENQELALPKEEITENDEQVLAEAADENPAQEVVSLEAEKSKVEANNGVNAMSTVTNAGEVTLDVATGVIKIDDTGYTQNNGTKVPFTGKYILTGTYATPSTDDRVTITGGSKEKPIEVVLDNVTIDNTSPNIISTGAALLVGSYVTGRSGHVTLTLVGRSILNGSEGHAGIEFEYKDVVSTLTIEGTGSLNAKGGAGSAGIGTADFTQGGKTYQLTINGGTILSQGGQYGSGIGGGRSTNGADIIIHGGKITSTGGQYAAGIGGGTQQSHAQGVYDMLEDMSITIDGGEVVANGGAFCTGIGTGYIEYKEGKTPENLIPKKMTINIGGTADVTANGYNYGAGIGQSYTNFKVSPWIVDQINITGGNVKATGGWGSAGIGGAGYQGKTDGIVEEINITGGNVISTGGLYAAGIGTGYGSTTNKVNISNATVYAKSRVTLNSTTGSYDGFGAGIGAGFDGKIKDGISISDNAQVTAIGSLYSSGIGRSFSANLASPFPIVIEENANVVAYAMGDSYAELLKNDPNDVSEAIPDGPYLTAIDQECIEYAGSKISVPMLMGDFKVVPDENNDKEIVINSNMTRSTTRLTLPAMYGSFATTVPAGEYQVAVDDKFYAGDLTKRNEANLTTSFDVKNPTINTYWKIQESYKVKYNANGGLLSNLPVYEQGIMYDEVIPQLIPTRDGYNFKGWMYQDKVITNSRTYESLVKDSNIREIELIASWEKAKVEYDVSFETGEGSKIESMKAAEGDVIVKPMDPVREGYQFEGWYTDGTFTTAWDFNTPINANITLYAKWNPIVYQLHFDANTGTGTMSDMNYGVGENITLSKNMFVRTGFEFTGWNTTSDGFGTSYNDEAIINDMPASHITLYAQWKVQEPSYFIEIPKAIALKDDADGYAKQSGEIKIIKNIVDEPFYPNEDILIRTSKNITLSNDKSSDTFLVDVFKSDSSQYVDSTSPLIILNVKDDTKQQDTFTLKTKMDNTKTKNKYRGIMNFVIEFRP